MSDWTLDEFKTAGGESHFAEVVAGLTDAKDIKDVAVLIGARRVLGNQMREPRSKSLEDGLLSSCVEREREYIMDFCPGRRAVLVGGYVKKRNDTPVDNTREIERGRK